MPGRTFRIQKYMSFYKKSVICEKNTILLKKIEKKVYLFLAILTFLMVALEAQQNFMTTKYIFFPYLC